MLRKDFTVEEPLTKYTMTNLKSGQKMKIRVLSDFIDGKCVWGDNDEGKRVCTRRPAGRPIPTSAIGINKFSNNPESIKQFIAAIVWNYTTHQVEIFETDKSQVIGQIVEIENEDDWGDTKKYDLNVSKKGLKLDTTYAVLPSNKAPFECPDEWEHINLKALYTGEDPFTTIEQPASRIKMEGDDYLNPDEVADSNDDVPF